MGNLAYTYDSAGRIATKGGSLAQTTLPQAVSGLAYTCSPAGSTMFSPGRIRRAHTSNSYEYIGRETDATGLYYFRARYYNPLSLGTARMTFEGSLLE